jgi:hypothetical protein
MLCDLAGADEDAAHDPVHEVCVVLLPSSSIAEHHSRALAAELEAGGPQELCTCLQALAPDMLRCVRSWCACEGL